MKILQLTPRIPYPPNDGGAVAMLALTRGLAHAGCEVVVAALNTLKHKRNPQDFPAIATIHTVTINTEIRALAALRSLIAAEWVDGIPYPIERFYHQEFETLLHTLCDAEKFDAIILDGLQMAPYIPALWQSNYKSPILLRAHNVEHEIWFRLAKNATNPLKKLYFYLLARQIRHYEAETLALINGLIPITERDAQAFAAMGWAGATYTLPVGMNLPNTAASNLSIEPYSIGFLGSLDWLPNVEGIQWFITKVLPRILQNTPTVTVHIAGRGGDTTLIESLRQHPNIRYHGAVPDSTVFLVAQAVIIVPLFSGSGMRVKVIEAFAHHKAVVATPIGVEGIACIDGVHYLQAEAPDAFADAVQRLMHDSALQDTLATAAQQFVRAHYDETVLAKSFVHWLGEAIEKEGE